MTKVVYGPDGYSIKSHRNRGIQKRVTEAERQAFIDELRQMGAGEECIDWPWGTRDRHGYGRLGIDYRRYLAHRWVYEQIVGPIPEGLDALHHCDRPPCCRPNHLFLGDQMANMQDMVGKGRKARGERAGGAKLTRAAVAHLFEMRAAGATLSSVATELGISRSQASRIWRGDRWSATVREMGISNVRS